ncbi:MAG: hypothetical protein J0H88_13765 [Sphingomonadales bacterium]|nr:hypothetical protein [Sphingomonadales bacterium]
MTTNTTSATASKSSSPQRHIDLEHVYGELQVATVFIDATEQFLCDLRMAMPDSDPSERTVGICLQIDTMLCEIKRVTKMVYTDLSDFIDASPAANLRVGVLS